MPDQYPLIYIEPNCIEIDTVFDNPVKPLMLYHDFVPKMKHENFFDEKFSIIVSPPGLGKSRFLLELVRKSFDLHIPAYYVNLKFIGPHSIKDFINSNFASSLSTTYETSADLNLIKRFYSSKTDLNPNGLFCFDSLDEVKTDQYEVIQKLLDFRSKFPESKIILTCRDYIFAKHNHSFNQVEHKLFRLNPLSGSDIRNYLEKFQVEQNIIDRIFVKFSSQYSTQLINIPRFLEVLCKQIVKSETPEAILELSKTELIELFIYAELKNEDIKNSQNKAELLKRVLESLALTMEIYQQNVITKDEFMTFLSEVQSNLASALLNQVSIEEFYERNLLQPVEDDLQFHNKDFQEYLAAKELSRNSKLCHAIFDLIFDDELSEFFPSWFNTIQYLVSINPTLIPVFIEFIFRRNNPTDEPLINYIIPLHSNVLSNLNDTQKHLIFENVFNYYLSNKKIVDWSLAEYIGTCIPPHYDEIIKSKFEETLTAPSTDTDYLTCILGFIRGGLIHETINVSLWKNIFTDAISSNRNSIHYIIQVLVVLKDVNILLSLYDYKMDFEAQYQILTACNTIDPNDDSVVKFILEYLNTDKEEIAPYITFNQISHPDAICTVLSYIFNEITFFEKINDRNELYSEFVKNIDKSFTKEIDELLQKLVFKYSHFFHYNNFIISITNILKNNNPDFLITFTDFYIENIPNEFIHRETLLSLITIDNIQQFLNHVKPHDNEDLQRSFAKFFYFFRITNPDFFEISKSSFSSYYKEFDESQKSYNLYPENSQGNTRIINHFERLIDPNDIGSIERMFDFYNSNHKIIKPLLTPEQKTKIKDIITNQLLNITFDSNDFSAVITGNSITRFNMPRLVSVFIMAFRYFAEFDICISQYRQQLIKCIPFAFNNDNNSTLYSLLGPLTPDEINLAHTAFDEITNEQFIVFHINNLISFCEQYKPKIMSELLLKYVKSVYISSYYRKELLDVYISINSSEPDLKDVLVLLPFLWVKI